MRAPKAKGKTLPLWGTSPSPVGSGPEGSWVPGGCRCPLLGVSVTLSPLCHRFAPTFPEAVILRNGDVAFRELLEAGQSAVCFAWAVGIPALAQAGALPASPRGFVRTETPGGGRGLI